MGLGKGGASLVKKSVFGLFNSVSKVSTTSPSFLQRTACARPNLEFAQPHRLGSRRGNESRPPHLHLFT